MQVECEARFDKFPDIYRCTHDAVVARNPAILQDARAKLYLLRGEQLAQEVDAGQRSNIDAKVEWQRLYVELKTAKDQEIMSALAAMPRSPALVPAAAPTASPTPTVVNSQVNCTSNLLGGTVYTNCH
jgi:hypothetical protein